MTPDAAAPAARRLTPRPRLTLRRRLLLAVIGLLALTSIVIGTVSVVALHGSLMARLDAQVVAATDRSQGVVDRPGPAPGGAPMGPGPGDFLPIAGLPPLTIGGVVRNGELTAAVLGSTLQSAALAPAQERLLLDAASTTGPVTVDLGGDLGEYRVAVGTSREGDGILVGLPLSDVRDTVGHVLLLVAAITIAGLAGAFIAGSAIVRRALRPLERVASTATHVSELPLERGEVALAVRVPDEDADPATEVGQVGAAINRMLGHVSSALSAREASERRVRAFVADASHELRTPLASIRGYSELTRRGGHDLPPDVVHALARVESESVRMTGLVEDLLLLARLDDGRALESAHVDLSAMIADTVSDAHAAGQDHGWSVLLPDEPVVVTGDAMRLHQVLANLLANARVHTPAGTEVTTTLEQSGSDVIVTVADDGPGIDEAVLPTVFERFARADASRSRTAGSTGLGLAIVTAIVEAHGGTVTVESAPGRTAFTVRLPEGT